MCLSKYLHGVIRIGCERSALSPPSIAHLFTHIHTHTHTHSLSLSVCLSLSVSVYVVNKTKLEKSTSSIRGS